MPVNVCSEGDWCKHYIESKQGTHSWIFFPRNSARKDFACSLASGSKCIEGCVIPRNLGSWSQGGVLEFLPYRCTSSRQSVGGRGQWGSGLCQVACSGCNISLPFGIASIEMMYSRVFAKSACMQAKLFSPTRWFLSFGHLWTTLASFCEWMEKAPGSQFGWIKQQIKPRAGVCIKKSYLGGMRWR